MKPRSRPTLADTSDLNQWHLAIVCIRKSQDVKFPTLGGWVSRQSHIKLTCVPRYDHVARSYQGQRIVSDLFRCYLTYEHKLPDWALARMLYL
jgi:hypothetical protein